MIYRKALFLFLMAAGLLAGTGWAAGSRTGTILVTDLRMRSGPGTAYRVLTGLEKGDQVMIQGCQDGWLQIKYRGMDGFVLDRKDFIAYAANPQGFQPRRQNNLKNPDSRAESITEQLRRTRVDLEAISRKERKILEEFEDAEEILDRTRKQVRIAEAELADLNNRITEIENQYQELDLALKDREDYAAKRLTALYKLNWVGRIQLLATADSFFDFIHRRSALQKILAQDEALLEELNNSKTALETLLAQLNAKKAEKRSLELSLNEQLKGLADRQKRRKSLLKKIRSEKSLELEALEALRQAGVNLNAAVERMEPSVPEQAPAPRTRTAGKPFEDYKGLLSWPVRGKILSFFGPHRDKKYAVTNFESGINIQAERGEPIRCVSGGYTIFSSWFKGFGNMIIIDHGDHYYTVYAHLEEVFKVKGDRVEKNEVIATVGDSGSMMGPALHFEVRHHGKSVDPLEWIHKG